MRTVAVLLVGVAVGVVLSYASTHLAGTFGPIADSAGAWLTAPFVLGVLMRTRRGAAAAGAACALVQLGSTSATTALRGLPIDSRLVWFWLACALIGGPLLATAGYLARRGHPSLHGLGGATAAAVFIAEAVWNEFHELHADAVGWLWVAIALVICVVLLPSPRRVRWLALTVPLGFVGEIALTQIYR
jgi:hypothetical protein